MIYTIRNSLLSVSVNSKGAAMTSIQGANKREFLWHGDPAIWAGQAPNLFPFIGKINNGCYRYEGETYFISRHGFARDHEFSLLEHKDDSLTLRLSSCAESLVMYPFNFHLDVRFSLFENRLSIAYQVHNLNDAVMPFSLGAHPAFACNWQVGDQISDYYLEFEQEETSHYVQFNGQSLGRERHPCLQHSDRLDLTESMFEIDSIIFDDLKSQSITLRNRKDENARQWIRVEYQGFPYMGIWSKPKAPYICIEPWYGVDDYEDATGELMQKEGVQKLAANDVFNCQYHIVIGDPQAY